MGVLDRRAILTLSVAISVVAHGVFLVASPSLVLMGRGRPEGLLPETVRVRLLDKAELQQYESAPGAAGSGLATRPGSITDLIQNEMEKISPEDNALTQTVDVPGIDERVARDQIARAEPIAPSEELQQHVDSQILEISQATARDDIQIERRLVAPSSTRIIPEGENPVLRGIAGAGDEMLVIDPLGFGGNSGKSSTTQDLGGSPAQEIDEPDPLKPAREQPLEQSQDDILRGLPDLPVEKVVARAPIVSAIEKNARFDFIDETVSMQLSTFVPANEREGYFRLQIVPKENGTLASLPKDVTFVIDASSSIVQRKLDQSLRGVLASINALRKDDRFNIVIFRDTPTLFQQDLVTATNQNKNAAAQFLKGQQSRGETNVYEGIRPVINQKPRDGVPGIVFVVSDGKPTSGIKDGRTLINALTDENQSRYSIFAFAGGKTVNLHLLDLLAYRNKGESNVAPQIEDMNKALPDFFSRLNDPLLVDCNADFGRINDATVYPKQIPGFSKGQAVTLYGRFDPKRDREFAMRLTGLAGDRKKEVVFKADLTKAAKGDDTIARNWAFRRIYYLIGEATRAGETPELIGQIRALAQQYGIRTSYDQ